MRIDYTKVSKHTWAFRIRLRRETGSEGVAVLRRVTDQEFERLKASKVRFDEYKKQLLDEYKRSLKVNEELGL